jgi:hypothetical protein
MRHHLIGCGGMDERQVGAADDKSIVITYDAHLILRHGGR